MAEPTYIVVQIRDENTARAVSLIRHAIHDTIQQRHIDAGDTVVYSDGRGTEEGEVWYDHSTWAVIDNTYRFIAERARYLSDKLRHKTGRHVG